jgi:DNA-binding NtrC family response regulator
MELVDALEFPHMIAKNSEALHVLVVDDEPLIRWSLAQTLSDRGHEVVESGTAASTRATLDDGFDVVLLDFRLPDSDNLDLLATIRRRAPQVQVILMTAFGTPEVVRGALQLGAYRVINKPFDMAAVADLVAQAAADRIPGGTH